MPILCFLCNEKLYGERTRVCSSITPYSNASYLEVIGELIGEDFVIIVTPADHMCKRCSADLLRMDKIAYELKPIKTAFRTMVLKKYGILPADQPVMSPEVDNMNLRTNDLAIGQRIVSRDFTVRKPCTSGSGSNAPTKISQDPSTIKIYKCYFCSIQFKDLGHFRNHMGSHVKKNDSEKSYQTVTKTVTQPDKTQHTQHQNQKHQLSNIQINIQTQQQQKKKKLYRSNKHETEVILEEAASVFQPHKILNSIEYQQITIICDEDKSNLIDKECTMDMDIDILLKDNTPDEISEVPTQKTQNIFEDISGHTELLHVIQGTPAANVNIGNMAIGGVETGTDYLDIESMLAAMDDVSPPNDGGNAQHFL